MRSPLLLWVVAGALVLLHFLLHVGLGLGPEAPDLLTVALLLAARHVEEGAAAGAGLFLGVLEDALSVLSFGANAVALTLVGMLGAMTRDLFVGDSRLFLVSYFLLGKWVRDLVSWLMVGETIRGPFVDEMLVQSGLASLYAAAVGLLVMALTGLWRDTEA